MATMTIREVRRRLADAIALVAQGEEVALTRRGRVVARLVAPAVQDLDSSYAQAIARWSAQCDRSAWDTNDDPFAGLRDRRRVGRPVNL